MYRTPRRHDHQKLKKDKKYKNLETNKLSLLSQQKNFSKYFQCLLTVYILVSYQSSKPFLLVVQYYGNKEESRAAINIECKHCMNPWTAIPWSKSFFDVRTWRLLFLFQNWSYVEETALWKAVNIKKKKRKLQFGSWRYTILCFLLAKCDGIN